MGSSVGILFTLRAIMRLSKRLFDIIKSPARLWKSSVQKIRSKMKKTTTSEALVTVPQDISRVGHSSDNRSSKPSPGQALIDIANTAIQIPPEVESLNQIRESQEDDTRSQASANGLVDDSVSDTKTQLSSIPPQPVISADGSSVPAIETGQRTALPDRALSLIELIPHLPIDHRLEKSLHIKDIINLGLVNREFHRVVLKDFLLNQIIVKTRIKFHTRQRETRGRDRESLDLYPVIRRVDKEDRVLPCNRIVYEPDFTQNRPSYRPGEFTPDEIEFHLPNELHSQPYFWPLGDELVIPRKTRVHYREERNTPVSNICVVQSVFYKFQNAGAERGDDFPVNVFYKRDGESPAARLHAVSIPWDRLLERLLCEPGRASNGGGRRNHNRRHP
jgi:hypothetical protein